MISFRTILSRFALRGLAGFLITGLAFATVSITGADAVKASDGATATLIVITRVTNNYGGTKSAGDFNMVVLGANPSPENFPGTPDGMTVTIDAGVDYSVDEDTLDGYSMSLGSACQGQLAADEVATCLVTNDQFPAPYVATTGTLILISRVINDNTGVKTPADFTLTVAAAGATQFAAGSPDGVSVVIPAGDYSVLMPSVAGYTATKDEGCTGVLLGDETRICTVTNDDVGPGAKTKGILTVIVNVSSGYGGTATAADFTLNAIANGASPSSFTGLAEGTRVSVDPGAYSITENDFAGYNKSLDSGCSGEIAAGQELTCTVTNVEYRSVSGSGSSGGGWGGSSGSSGGGSQVIAAGGQVAQEQTSLIMVPGLSFEQLAESGAPTVLGIETDVPSIEEFVVEGTDEPIAANNAGPSKKNRVNRAFVSNFAAPEEQGQSDGPQFAVQYPVQTPQAEQAVGRPPVQPVSRTTAQKTPNPVRKPFDIPFALISFAALIAFSGLCLAGFKEVTYVPRHRKGE